MSTNRISGLGLHSEYIPSAIYYADADTVEYIRSDVPCIQRRVDGILTLNLDLRTRKLIGFRVKGFRNFFLNHLKEKYPLLEGDFIALVSVLEHAVQVVGNACTDPDCREAYRSARKMAHDDRVALEPLAA
jgi:hypothetical protein